MNEIYETIAKAFLLAGQLPLDAKLVFPNLTVLRNLGFQNEKAFTYYEYMKVLCQENGQYYVWQEVPQESTDGVLPENFLYPDNVITNLIDYSNRYFNFVIETKSETSNAIGKPFLIMKDFPTNDKDFLEINDCVWGYFTPTQLMLARYKGGTVINISSWAVIQTLNPKLYS